MSVVRLIVATQNSGPPASGKIIKEMPGSVASGTPYIYFSIKFYNRVFISQLVGRLLFFFITRICISHFPIYCSVAIILVFTKALLV